MEKLINFLEKIILTGVLEKEAFRFYNISINGITEIEFANCFGFTENEIEELINKMIVGSNFGNLSKNMIDTIKEKIKEWYNGYYINKNLLFIIHVQL